MFWLHRHLLTKQALNSKGRKEKFERFLEDLATLVLTSEVGWLVVQEQNNRKSHLIGKFPVACAEDKKSLRRQREFPFIYIFTCTTVEFIISLFCVLN